ncbi:hypothetical protein LINPERHAP1_LOCUS8568 [Linum perenne]
MTSRSHEQMNYTFGDTPICVNTDMEDPSVLCDNVDHMKR